MALSLHHDFTISAPTEPGDVTPGPHQHQTLTALLDDVVVWSQALQTIREGAPA
ncbi:hypothetical protein [Sphaerisporangium fuscum]|uniref:hypothetical protein n=1 Tax=Sphaerisporangium fuscum TaxID=2835868 RepID=UPI001BDD52D9|nr:hypothetical protein [Sphaerisporangium fuscum]